MPIALTNLTAEIQTRCNALTAFSTVNAVIDCAVAAKKLEMAGGSINRTVLDAELQRVITAAGNGSLIEDLIALAASVEQRATNGKTRKTRAFTTSDVWTKPLDVDSVEILLVGGGGGGGGISTQGTSYSGTIMCSGSGGGGQVIKQDLDISSITAGTAVPIIIGSAGIAGGSAGTPGGHGGSSSFGSLLTALGGGGGDGYPTANATSITGIFSYGGGSGWAPSNPISGLSGLGGGAGGPPTLASINTSNGQSYVHQAAGVQAGSTAFFWYGISTIAWAKAAPGMFGYGAGGGIKNSFRVAAESYAGGFNGVAQPNRGGGGAGLLQDVSNGNFPGCAGGSGFCLLTWWE